jgi:hypothetical protein
MVHDESDDGSGGKANFNFSHKNATRTVTDDKALGDDKAELRLNNDETAFIGRWDWGELHTDGGALDMGNLDTPWTITITPTDLADGTPAWVNINSWVWIEPGPQVYVLEKNQPITITYDPTDFANQCTGTIPANATLCSLDDLSLSADTPRSVAHYCTPAKCEYRCNQGYIKNSSGACIPGKLVFVSASKYTGNLGGVAGADAKCQGEATAKGLNGTFKAWLSSSDSNDPESRFVHSPVPYYLLNGAKIADNWTDLVDGALMNNISLDINSNTVSSYGSYVDYFWTNTLANGTTNRTAPAWGTCGGFTTADNLSAGMVGNNTVTNAAWTYNMYMGLACGNNFRLYCFGQ